MNNPILLAPILLMVSGFLVACGGKFENDEPTDEVLGDGSISPPAEHEETSEEQDELCAMLEELVYKGGDPRVSPPPPPETPLEEARQEFYFDCIDPAQSGGWKPCLTEKNPFFSISTNNACDEEVRPFLECLVASETQIIDDCAMLQLSENCDPRDSYVLDAQFETCSATHIGMYTFNDGVTVCDGDCLRYNIDVQCQDDHGYSFFCSPPDGNCSVSCSCLVDGVETHTITIEQVHEMSFQYEVTDACGFPE